MIPRSLWSISLWAPLAVALSLASLVSSPALSLGQPRTCARAQRVEGVLRCDEELVVRLRALCPAADDLALGPGDAVHACVVERMPAEDLAALGQVVELNTADAEELASLPGIGPALAARIIAGRPYAAVDELLRVRGIGPKRLAALRPRARVGGKQGRARLRRPRSR